MPRPIVMTDEIKRKALADFSEMLDGVKMSDGKLSYRKSFNYESGHAVVWLTPEAYRKTMALVMGFSDEVGWHGIVSRAGDSEFVVEDIFVYPQEVTSSTVKTDQAEYTRWLYTFKDEAFDKLRMQGHSHCNMGVSPSGVDDKHRQQILGQLEPDMFYIFMIWNKSLAVHTLVYDMQRNILYEDKDVEVKLLGDEGMDEFLADAKEKVLKPSHKRGKHGHGAKTQPIGQIEHGTIHHNTVEHDTDYEAFEYHRQLRLYGLQDYGGEAWGL